MAIYFDSRLILYCMITVPVLVPGDHLTAHIGITCHVHHAVSMCQRLEGASPYFVCLIDPTASPLLGTCCLSHRMLYIVVWHRFYYGRSLYRALDWFGVRSSSWRNWRSMFRSRAQCIKFADHNWLTFVRKVLVGAYDEDQRGLQLGSRLGSSDDR